MSSADKRIEVAQQLIHEKQEEIDRLNRKLEVLVWAMLASGLTVEKALENMESNRWCPYYSKN